MPDRAVGVFQRVARHPLRQDRILEHDDAPDQVHVLRVRLARDFVRVVVRLGSADPAGERDGRRLEGDLAAFVLDVDLDRVQALPAHAHVLAELAGGDEGHGHVDAPDLLRPLREDGRLLVMLDRGRDAARLRRSAGQRSDHRGDRRGYHDQDPECGETSPSYDLAAALSSRPQSPASLVRELVPHRDREVCLPGLARSIARTVRTCRQSRTRLVESEK